MGEVPAHNLGLGVEGEDGAEAEFLLAGAQGAHEVAEVLGEHGDGAVHEIDGGGAVLGLAVDDVALTHVVAHVGDVYAYFPEVVLQASHGEGVVKVFGVLGVDGEGQYVAEVLAAGYLLACDTGVDALCGFRHGGGILVGQAVLGEDGVHLGCVVAGVAEDIHHAAYGVLGGRGPVHDFDHGLLAVEGALETGLGDEDVAAQAAVCHVEEGVVALHLQAAHITLADEGFIFLAILDAVGVEGIDAARGLPEELGLEHLVDDIDDEHLRGVVLRAYNIK